MIACKVEASEETVGCITTLSKPSTLVSEPELISKLDWAVKTIFTIENFKDSNFVKAYVKVLTDSRALQGTLETFNVPAESYSWSQEYNPSHRTRTQLEWEREFEYNAWSKEERKERIAQLISNMRESITQNGSLDQKVAFSILNDPRLNGEYSGFRMLVHKALWILEEQFKNYLNIQAKYYSSPKLFGKQKFNKAKTAAWDEFYKNLSGQEIRMHETIAGATHGMVNNLCRSFGQTLLNSLSVSSQKSLFKSSSVWDYVELKPNEWIVIISEDALDGIGPVGDQNGIFKFYAIRVTKSERYSLKDQSYIGSESHDYWGPGFYNMQMIHRKTPHSIILNFGKSVRKVEFDLDGKIISSSF